MSAFKTLAEKKRETQRERMAEAAAQILAPGEELIKPLAASRYASFWWLAVGVGLFTTRNIAGWVALALVAIGWAYARRPYFLLITDQRVAFVRVSLLSSKRFSFEDGLPREQIEDTDIKKKWSELVLTITPKGRRSRRFAIDGSLEEESDQIEATISGRPSAPLGSG